jgi:hypothetical protein
VDEIDKNFFIFLLTEERDSQEPTPASWLGHFAPLEFCSWFVLVSIEETVNARDGRNG